MTMSRTVDCGRCGSNVDVIEDELIDISWKEHPSPKPNDNQYETQFYAASEYLCSPCYQQFALFMDEERETE